MRILVVNDDDDLRSALDGLLTAWGYDTVSVGQSHEALQFLSSGEVPDLLLSEVHFRSGPSGEDVAAAARLCNPSVSVLFLTGSCAAGAAYGARDRTVYLDKFARPAEIRTAIEALVSGAGAARVA